ncbi:hypothetical protein [Emticicia agri]|uniref:Uncharacterized protein n=1 Tax=Emticicia agri TaxID=2492393 RepID=A0A4Q5LX94_9BACT|nr:hypothetical protein [Emticicia agri]RYU94235.1 hypothetical protein EWM59_18225 [Emticicia agri]
MNVTCTLFFYSGLLPALFASKQTQLIPKNQDTRIDSMRYDTRSLLIEWAYLLCLPYQLPLPQSVKPGFERKLLFKPENESVIVT